MATTTMPMGTRTALTVTGLSTLASGTFVASNAYNCSTNNPIDVVIEVSAQAGSVSGNKQLVVYAQSSMDGTNFQSGPTSGTSTTNELDLQYIGVVPMGDTSLHTQEFSIAQAFGFLPKYFKIICKNDLGAALTSGTVFTAEISSVTA